MENAVRKAVRSAIRMITELLRQQLRDRSFGSAADNDIDFEPDVLGRDLGGPLAATLRPVIFDRDGATFDPTEFAQPLHKRGDPLGLGCGRARASLCSKTATKRTSQDFALVPNYGVTGLCAPWPASSSEILDDGM